ICTRISHINPEIAVTGGQDDRAFVWSTKDGSVILECTGHTDTVNSVGFSHDGSLVATADMKGLIKVWQVDTCLEIWSFEADEVEWVQWHHAAPVLLAGTRDGQVWMWKIPSGDLKTFVGHGPGATCGKFLPDGKHACVGYEDGTIKIWDLKSNQTVHSVSGHEGHQEAVFCLDHNSNGSLLLSGSGDMTAKVTNTATGKIVSTLRCQQLTDEDSVESVAFSKTHDYAVTGTLGGSLEIWDLPSKTVRHKCDHPYGVVKILWSQSGATFYTSCLDGNVRQFDSRNGQLVKTWHGHTAGIMDFDIARDESIIVTASDDSTSKVFSLAKQAS
ncbi:angio-associated migratory cell protein, partial [Plakobranchus ocellatus]